MNYTEILGEWKDKCGMDSGPKKYTFDLIYGGYVVYREKTGEKNLSENLWEKSFIHYILHKTLLVGEKDKEKLLEIISDYKKISKGENRLKLFIVEWPIEMENMHLRRDTTESKLIVAKNEQDAIKYGLENYYWIDDTCFPDNPDPGVFTVKFVGYPSKEYLEGDIVMTSFAAIS